MLFKILPALDATFLEVTLHDDLGAAETLAKKVIDLQSPVLMKNLGWKKSLNQIEIFNSGGSLVREVSVQIMGFPSDECWWESPNNSDQQLLYIPYIEPNYHIEQELMFTHFEDSETQFQISWKDELGIKHSEITPVRLKGMCN